MTDPFESKAHTAIEPPVDLLYDYHKLRRLCDREARERAQQLVLYNRVAELRAEIVENERRADDASQTVRTRPTYLGGTQVVSQRFPTPPGFEARQRLLEEQLEEARAELARVEQRHEALSRVVSRCRQFLVERGIDPDQPIARAAFVQRTQPSGFDSVVGESPAALVVGA